MTFDAVVVGGGPAGSTCARQLRRAGLTVAVLDRARFPRDKVCAGWITPGVVDLLALDVEEYRRQRVFQPITAFRTSVMGAREIETRYAEPISYGIRRYEFDHYLLDRCGAHVSCGRPVSSLRRTGDGWRVNETISTPLLIGAGGHFCPVARWLNPTRPTAPLVATLELETRLRPDQIDDCRVRPDSPVLFFCRDLKGYGWCFRKQDFLNVGLGRHDPRHLPRQTAAFVDFLKAEGLVPRDLPRPSRGHAYLLNTRGARRTIADGVVLIGDAAGLADPRSGEGIRQAIESGLLAARAILAAAGRYEAERLQPYARGLRPSGAGPTSRLVSRAVPARATQRVGGLLMRSPWFTRHVLLDRWFLDVRHPSVPENLS